MRNVITLAGFWVLIRYPGYSHFNSKDCLGLEISCMDRRAPLCLHQVRPTALGSAWEKFCVDDKDGYSIFNQGPVDKNYIVPYDLEREENHHTIGGNSSPFPRPHASGT